MPAITSLGIGSGLDINSMVSQLVALEGRPLEQMKTQATQLQTQVSSFGKLSSLFSALQTAANKLTSNFDTRRVNPLQKPDHLKRSAKFWVAVTRASIMPGSLAA